MGTAEWPVIAGRRGQCQLAIALTCGARRENDVPVVYGV
jgi:hypothetical protein